MANKRPRAASPRRKRGATGPARIAESGATSSARPASGARGAGLPKQLEGVITAAEAVIAETRRVIEVVRRDLRKQRAATRVVLTGQSARRRRRGRRRSRPPRK